MGKVGKLKNRWVIWSEIRNYLSESKRNASWELSGWIKKEILEVKKNTGAKMKIWNKWRHDITAKNQQTWM